MKKINALLVVVAIIAIVCGSSCSKSIDPIWGTKHSNDSYAKDFPLEKFHELGMKGDTTGQKAIVDENRKVLTKNVITNYPCIKDEKNILFVLGSGFAKKVKSGDGKTYSGKFKNELIIILNDPCIKDTLFLACGNGMLSPIEWDRKSYWGTAEKCRFEIQPGQSLATYLPALQAWASVASTFPVPIKDKNGKVVSQETYLNHLGRYESVLFPGDMIDMCLGKVFNEVGQEVQFDRRLAESKKANAALTKKAAKKHRKK